MEIFLVENSQPVLKRLCELLSTLPGAIVLGRARRADHAIHDILKWRPEVVLLDLELDQGSGLEVLTALRADAPEVDVYVLTNYVSAALREMCRHQGAKGFFDKTCDFDALRELLASRAARDRSSARVQ